MSDQPRPTPSKPLRFFQCLYDEKRDACYFETPTGRSRWYAKQGACKTDAFLAEQECKRRGWILNRESDAREERIRELEAELLNKTDSIQIAADRIDELKRRADHWCDMHTVAVAENAKLREALEGVWQPITTAPKDGLIDIWTVGFGADPHRVSDCYYDSICSEWRTSRPMGYLHCIPGRFVTHWMRPPQLQSLAGEESVINKPLDLTQRIAELETLLDDWLEAIPAKRAPTLHARTLDALKGVH
jgi:hypothetical protein